MKKLKIMLLSLALFAVVGGALAFKAKYNADYCTTNTIQDPGTGAATCAADPLVCPLFENIDPVPQVGVRLCTTTLNEQGNCSGVIGCTILSTFVNDN